VPGDVYNIGACKARTVRELLELLLSQVAVGIEVRQDSQRLRPVDTFKIVGDCSKLRNQTGWEPQIPFEQTVKDVLDFWRKEVVRGGQSNRKL
jgi:GDP-4-dehydro-6-deoxy-D-mannose reductase